MISIEFLDNDTVPNSSDEYLQVPARIIIGDFSESLLIPLHYWSKSNYLGQWLDALDRIVGSDDSTAALVTEMYNSLKDHYALMWWPIYRLGDYVYVRNGYLNTSSLPNPVTFESLYTLIPKRDPNIQSDGPSEWISTLANVKEFRATLQSRLHEDYSKR